MSEMIKQKVEQALLTPALSEVGAQIGELAQAYGHDNEIAQLLLNFVENELGNIKASLDTQSIPEPQFASVFEFVDDWLLHVYPYTQARERDVKWTPFWWSHPEAVLRLTSLWQRFENLRVAEPATYLETFLRVHADYHMRVLMADEGVFDDSRREDTPSIPLPSAPIPEKK
ncbi:DUF4913 domain-containing protein [Corynebacterium callunae]|uniref:DUF4913 domain-containing protein n=1 Tax=Corynebacterium callunae DSM 20147 TaxID=1121353 RepID=M1TPC5_9CORY|nr:DUF4913 domain-containing protein [Corynebacterium callunae]AGG66196.1 hypothetical protein H924_03740 [Corynebacterium callunae DSM 20147]